MGHDLAPPGDQAGDGHGDLVGFAARVGKEGGGDIARRDFGQLGAEFVARLGGEMGADIAQARGLFLNRPHDFGMAMAEIDVDQLRRKIEIFAALGIVKISAFGIVEISAFAALDSRHRMDRVLRRPGNHVVAAVGALHRPGSRLALLGDQLRVCRPFCIGWKEIGKRRGLNRKRVRLGRQLNLFGGIRPVFPGGGDATHAIG